MESKEQSHITFLYMLH